MCGVTSISHDGDQKINDLQLNDNKRAESVSIIEATINWFKKIF